MAYRYTEMGYDGCSCMEELPNYCIICGGLCEHDTSYCDQHLAMKQQEDQVEINFALDDLGYYVNEL